MLDVLDVERTSKLSFEIAIVNFVIAKIDPDHYRHKSWKWTS